MRPIVVHWLEHYMRPDVANMLAPSWFMCVGIAGLVSLALMLALANKRGIESGVVASAVLWGYLAAVLAGIVVPMTIDAIERVASTGHVQLRWAGMTSFWGYLAGAGAIVAVCRREKLPVARMADLAAIPIGVALVFSRLGCFMAGCDYGKISSLPWAMRFPAGSPAWRDQIHVGLIPAGRLESLAVQPTQLYEALLGLVIVAIVWTVSRRTRTEGRMFFAAAITYAIGRLLIEMVRGDAGRGIYHGLSSGQIFSMLVLIALAARFLFTKRVIVYTTPIVLLGLLGHAHAQPGPHDPVPDSDPTPMTNDLSQPLPMSTDDQPPPIFDVPTPPPPRLDLPRPRPIFAIGALLGGATALNRPGEQVADLSGATLSLGYIPGRFGLWLDVDKLNNGDASHTSAVASVSFAPRITPHLWIGARAGVGVAHVSFMDSQFEGVTASDVRLEAIAEVVIAHNWAIWVRPMTIDVMSAAALGGPITTLQFRAGIAYRFGERGGIQ